MEEFLDRYFTRLRTDIRPVYKAPTLAALGLESAPNSPLEPYEVNIHHNNIVLLCVAATHPVVERSQTIPLVSIDPAPLVATTLESVAGKKRGKHNFFEVGDLLAIAKFEDGSSIPLFFPARGPILEFNPASAPCFPAAATSLGWLAMMGPSRDALTPLVRAARTTGTGGRVDAVSLQRDVYDAEAEAEAAEPGARPRPRRKVPVGGESIEVIFIDAGRVALEDMDNE